MKKLAFFIMLIITTLCCVFAFPGCDEDVSKLAMNKRYINEADVDKDADEQQSYVFHSNGTGEYTYHFNGGYPNRYHIVIHFKYTYVDSDKRAVVGFYDSLERLEDDDGKFNNNGWTSLVTISKNVLATADSSGYTFWINEDYLKTIPNFGV